MNQITEVTIVLPEEEAKRWILFQQYYEPFGILVERGVFNIRNGSATLHFDTDGVLSSVIRTDALYNKRFTKQ